jgi:hypothetical protein
MRAIACLLIPLAATVAAAGVGVPFHRPGMQPARINDRLMPRNATDGFAPNFDFWPHRGTAEWVVE